MKAKAAYVQTQTANEANNVSINIRQCYAVFWMDEAISVKSTGRSGCKIIKISRHFQHHIAISLSHTESRLI